MTKLDIRGAGPITSVLTGVTILGCAAAAAVCAVAPMAIDKVRGSGYAVTYLWILLPLLGGLVVTGLLVAARSPLGRPAAAAAAVLAAQVTGYGVVAVRDWFNLNGAGPGMRPHTLAVAVTFAAGVALCAVVAATISVVSLWREPERGWPSLLSPRPACVVGGVLLAVVLPVLLATVMQDTDITTLGQFALTFGLPWGAGLALAGWGARRGRIAVYATISLSVLLAATQWGSSLVRAALS